MSSLLSIVILTGAFPNFVLMSMIDLRIIVLYYDLYDNCIQDTKVFLKTLFDFAFVPIHLVAQDMGSVSTKLYIMCSW